VENVNTKIEAFVGIVKTFLTATQVNGGHLSVDWDHLEEHPKSQIAVRKLFATMKSKKLDWELIFSMTKRMYERSRQLYERNQDAAGNIKECTGNK